MKDVSWISSFATLLFHCFKSCLQGNIQQEAQASDHQARQTAGTTQKALRV
jgi:hypothetical protein